MAEYVCKRTGKRRSLREEGRLLLVRFEDGVKAKRALPTGRLFGLIVESVAESTYTLARLRVSDHEPRTVAEMAERLVEHPLVRAAAPMAIDEEGFPWNSVPGEVTVHFRHGTSDERREDILSNLGSTVVRAQRTPGYYTVSVPDGRHPVEQIRRFQEEEEVLFAEGSLFGFDDRLEVPDDPLFGDQWHHANSGQLGGAPGADVDTSLAWNLETGDPDTVIVVIDTGADLDHEDLVGNLYPQGAEDWDFSTIPETVPEDTDGHGTACAGLAAAVADNGIGVAGVCRDCRFVPLEVDLSGGAYQNRADAIQYVAALTLEHPHLRPVISLSWRQTAGHFAAIEQALEVAHERGIPVIAAAGNNDGPVVYPAAYPTTLAVGATSMCDERKSPSSCDGDLSWGSNHGPELDLVAPGTSITTTKIGGYRSDFDGTSASAPIVAGIAGLVLSRNPYLDADEVFARIRDHAADEVGIPHEDTPGFDEFMGHGRADALASVTATWQPTAPTITSISPDEGTLGSSTEVELLGTDFLGEVAVLFGGVPADSVEVLADDRIRARVPIGEDLVPIDVEVTADLGTVVVTDGFRQRPVFQLLDEPRPDTEVRFFATGPVNGDWGVVVDHELGPAVKRGLTWDLGFVEFDVVHNSFQTADAPLSATGQGITRWTVPDDPSLVGRPLYAQAAFDGNGDGPGRHLALSRLVEAVILP